MHGYILARLYDPQRSQLDLYGSVETLHHPTNEEKKKHLFSSGWLNFNEVKDKKCFWKQLFPTRLTN